MTGYKISHGYKGYTNNFFYFSKLVHKIISPLV